MENKIELRIFLLSPIFALKQLDSSYVKVDTGYFQLSLSQVFTNSNFSFRLVDIPSNTVFIWGEASHLTEISHDWEKIEKLIPPRWDLAFHFINLFISPLKVYN